ncbi:MAG: hypothetical protein FWH18_04145 [Marinilabiliaceae bacterium]|nr:hypothetical protein [Marinilabiliaceae bacterium]
MELTLDLAYSQIFNLVSQLPANQKVKIKYELTENSIDEKSEAEMSDFQTFILSAPTMSDEQYSKFKEHRTHFNRWRIE